LLIRYAILEHLATVTELFRQNSHAVAPTELPYLAGEHLVLTGMNVNRGRACFSWEENIPDGEPFFFIRPSAFPGYLVFLLPRDPIQPRLAGEIAACSLQMKFFLLSPVEDFQAAITIEFRRMASVQVHLHVRDGIELLEEAFPVFFRILLVEWTDNELGPALLLRTLVPGSLGRASI